MKKIDIVKKLLNYFIYLFIFFSLTYLIYFIKSDDPFKKQLRRDIKYMIKSKTLINHLSNDYNEEFLPNTEFIKVDYKKIKLDFLKTNSCFSGKCHTFFLEQFNENLIIIEKSGQIRITSFNNLVNKNLQLSKVQTNLDFDFVLDVTIDKDNIFISGATRFKNKIYLKVVKGKFDSKKIIFNEILKLRDKNCVPRISFGSGKIQAFKKDKILLSINGAGRTDKPSLVNLSSDSICGKILLIDTKNGNYEIFSSGHRNILGLYSDNDYTIATEHGPNGGDEINRIEEDKSYGWPIVSYGEYYSRDKEDLTPNYKKNHSLNKFEEPIFTFIPSIGISEIIKLENNFSELWEDNFLLASLNKKYLYRIKFEKDFSKVLYMEPIYIGDRIRDLIYNKRNKMIVLALEIEGSLGVIYKN